MTDQTTQPAETTGETVFARVDFTKPFYLVFDQSDARNHMEWFQGANCEERAIRRAREKATTTGRTVAVFGPQEFVFMPPATEAQPVQLPWKRGTTSEQ